MKTLLASLPLCAWAVSLSLVLWVRSFLSLAGATILVPLVSVPRSEQGDVVSDVTGFALVVAWGLLCMLLVEPAKAGTASFLGRRRGALYSLLLLYQVILLGDTVRTHAFDWWKWLLSLVGAATLAASSEMRDIAGFHFPWLSCAGAVAVGILFVAWAPKRAHT